MKTDLTRYSITEPNDVFTVTAEGAIMLGESLMTAEEAEILKEEATYIGKTRLWKILQETMIAKAHASVFREPTTYQNSEYAKAIMMLYTDYSQFLGILKGLTHKKPLPKSRKKVL